LAERPAGNRARANRANAARSTGPTSAEGKARVSRNNLGSGLFAGFEGDALLTGRARKLAARLAAEAGPTGGELVPMLAAAIAERSVELSHLRALRQAAVLGAQGRAAAEADRPVSLQTAALFAALMERLGDEAAPERMRRSRGDGCDREDEAERTALALRRDLKRLAALDRYEARALAARKRLIRRLDEARAEG